VGDFHLDLDAGCTLYGLPFHLLLESPRHAALLQRIESEMPRLFPYGKATASTHAKTLWINPLITHLL